ncbi:hypothetical protein [Flavicella sediminum]|uniref:hypothetical protein n=1 Tax=Flavicella sediminum TaxID=2585141 RepID=UPI001122D92B|nr:hypothetical protein [Flavicella sediminum]
MPELVAPLRGSLLTTNSTEIEWSCSDLDNDVLTYTVYLGTNESPEKVATVNSTSYTTNLLSKTNYYWRVDATDAHNNKTVGQIWSFQTE